MAGEVTDTAASGAERGRDVGSDGALDLGVRKRRATGGAITRVRYR